MILSLGHKFVQLDVKRGKPGCQHPIFPIFDRDFEKSLGAETNPPGLGIDSFENPPANCLFP